MFVELRELLRSGAIRRHQLGSIGILTLMIHGLLPAILMPANCSAAKQLSQFYKHSKSVDLLRKSLLSHVWRVPSSKALSCKHERLFDLLTLASSYGEIQISGFEIDRISGA